MATTPNYGIELPPDSLLVRNTALTLRNQATAIDTALGTFEDEVTTAKNAAEDAATAAENAASLVNAPADTAIATIVGNQASQTRAQLETWISSKGLATASSVTTQKNRIDVIEPKVNQMAPYTVDTGWVNVAVTAPYIEQPNYTPQVRRIGAIVYFRGGWNAQGMSTSTSYDVGILPVPMRPLITTYFTLGTNNPNNPGLGILWTDGRVQVRTASSMSSYYLFDTTTYLLD